MGKSSSFLSIAVPSGTVFLSNFFIMVLELMAKIAARLGNALATVGNFTEATEYFRQAVNLNPLDIGSHSMLAQALSIQGRYDEAIAELQKAIGFMSQAGNEEAAGQLKKLLELVELKKTNQQK